MQENQSDKCNDEMESNIDFEFFSTLFEPTRIEIVKLLAVEDLLTVQEVANHFPQDRSVVSRHLKALFDQGILLARKEGRSTRYSLNHESLIINFDKALEYLKQASCV